MKNSLLPDPPFEVSHLGALHNTMKNSKIITLSNGHCFKNVKA